MGIATTCNCLREGRTFFESIRAATMLAAGREEYYSSKRSFDGTNIIYGSSEWAAQREVEHRPAPDTEMPTGIQPIETTNRKRRRRTRKRGKPVKRNKIT